MKTKQWYSCSEFEQKIGETHKNFSSFLKRNQYFINQYCQNISLTRVPKYLIHESALKLISQLHSQYAYIMNKILEHRKRFYVNCS